MNEELLKLIEANPNMSIQDLKNYLAGQLDPSGFKLSTLDISPNFLNAEDTSSLIDDNEEDTFVRAVREAGLIKPSSTNSGGIEKMEMRGGTSFNVDGDTVLLPTSGNYDLKSTPLAGGDRTADQIMKGGTEPTTPKADFSNLFSPRDTSGLDLESNLFNLGNAIGSGRKGQAALAGGAALFNIARTTLSGVGVGKRGAQIDKLNEEKLQERLRKSNMIYGDGRGQMSRTYNKDGGEIPLERALTGEVITGTDRKGAAPDEVERNEFIKSPNGDVQKVLGDTHEKGGEHLTLEGGSKVISDNLKVGSNIAKALSKEFDIKVKAKDTFAATMDKYTKTLGLDKLNKEQEGLFKRLKDQESVENESTSRLNTAFLSKKIKEIEDQKAPLLEQRKRFFDKVFQAQEDSKPKAEDPNEAYFKDGGFKAMCDKFGLTVEQGKELVKKQDFYKNGGRKYENGGGKLIFSVPNRGSNEITIQDPAQFKRAQELMQQIVDDRESFLNKKGMLNVSDLPESYSKSLQELQIIVGDEFNISNLLAGEQEIPSGGKGRDTLVASQVFGDNHKGAVYQALPVEAQTQTTDTPATEEKYKPTDVNATNSSKLLFPDQSVLPPDAMSAHLLANRNLRQLDPVEVSPEQQIQEINRADRNARAQLDQLPDSQRRAAMANLAANSQNASNQAITQADVQNAANRQQTNQVNFSNENRVEQLRTMDLMDFERRQLTAEAKTREDIYRFDDYHRKLRLSKFNAQRSADLLNSIYPNFNIDKLGAVNFDPNSQSYTV